jgi:hypothetical protein
MRLTLTAEDVLAVKGFALCLLFGAAGGLLMFGGAFIFVLASVDPFEMVGSALPALG